MTTIPQAIQNKIEKYKTAQEYIKYYAKESPLFDNNKAKAEFNKLDYLRYLLQKRLETMYK